MATACYVYGIVPGDVDVEPDARGVGDPPGRITVIRQGDIAALVSEIDPERPLGGPEDLTTHARVVDTTAAVAPVLPLRFGSVVSDRQAVLEELLGAHHDEFDAALRELDGLAQYVLRGRYDQRTVLSEVLADDPRAAELREAIQGRPEDATRGERMALGELVDAAIASRREADTGTALRALQRLDVRVSPREPTHELDAVHLAFLAGVAAQRDVERVVDELAGEWDGRVEVRLLGPLAPYDFVVTEPPAARQEA
jgi:hypothetical protein